jgi:TPR repeat protein
MSRILGQRTRIGVSQFAIGVGLTLLFQANSVFAVDPDIPRIQAEAARGSIDGEMKLGAAYLAGRGIGQDEKQAAYWYEKAANSGDPVAQKQIGYLYEVGVGVPRDSARAVRWFERAVAGGNVNAKVDLGVAYMWGMGVKKDLDLSAKFFREAAAKGEGLGACFLGDMYYSGNGVAKDEAAARHWYEVGAKLHDPMSEYRMGVLDSQDRSNIPEVKKAAQYLRDSVAAGYVPAMYALGLLLVRVPNLTLPQDHPMALLREASEAGSWRASMILGALSRDGRGVPADRKTAYYEFVLAKLQGGETASALVAADLQILVGELGSTQAQATEADASAWYQKHHLPLEFVFKGEDNWRKFPLFAIQYPESDTHAGKIVTRPPS